MSNTIQLEVKHQIREQIAKLSKQILEYKRLESSLIQEAHKTYIKEIELLAADAKKDLESLS
jgi:hypothetical protein